MKYRVRLLHYSPMAAQLVVEADSEEDAERQALIDAKNADWYPIATSDDEIEIDSVEEVL